LINPKFLVFSCHAILNKLEINPAILDGSLKVNATSTSVIHLKKLGMSKKGACKVVHIIK